LAAAGCWTPFIAAGCASLQAHGTAKVNSHRDSEEVGHDLPFVLQFKRFHVSVNLAAGQVLPGCFNVELTVSNMLPEALAAQCSEESKNTTKKTTAPDTATAPDAADETEAEQTPEEAEHGAADAHRLAVGKVVLVKVRAQGGGQRSGVRLLPALIASGYHFLTDATAPPPYLHCCPLARPSPARDSPALLRRPSWWCSRGGSGAWC
jgi:hypothetical protein